MIALTRRQARCLRGVSRRHVPRPAEGPAPGEGGGNPAEAPRDSNDSGPTISTALQEQLGLKLESRREPVDLLVVESVEKVPTKN